MTTWKLGVCTFAVLGAAALGACGDDDGGSGGGGDDEGGEGGETSSSTGGTKSSTGGTKSSTGGTKSSTGGTSTDGGETASGGGEGGETSSSTGGKASTGGTSSDGGEPSSGGEPSAGGAGGFVPGECPEGYENYYDLWYGSDECAAYYGCIVDYSCMGQPDEAECRAASEQALQTAYCLPTGTVPPDEQEWAMACAQAYEVLAAQLGCE